MGIAFVIWVIDNVFYGGAMGFVPEGEEFFGVGEVGFGVHVEFFEDAAGALVAGEGGGDDVGFVELLEGVVEEGLAHFGGEPAVPVVEFESETEFEFVGEEGAVAEVEPAGEGVVLFVDGFEKTGLASAGVHGAEPLFNDIGVALPGDGAGAVDEFHDAGVVVEDVEVVDVVVGEGQKGEAVGFEEEVGHGYWYTGLVRMFKRDEGELVEGGFML